MLLKAFAGLAFLLVAIGAALFAPAGTLAYWQAWLFLAVFGAIVVAITIYLAARDPELLARRVQAGPVAEPRRGQQLVQALASLAFLAVFVVAGLDHRAGWSHVPVTAVIAGEVLVAAGLGVVFLVFRANTFTSAIVEVEDSQQLVSTGPYAAVRHPMYAGALLLMLGVPPATGSWLAWLVVPLLAAAIVWRLLDEEKLLVEQLAGYEAYRAKVRYRLVPHVW